MEINPNQYNLADTLNSFMLKIKKPGIFKPGFYYMDGLVSTGKQFPYTILKIIFTIRKKIFNYFINIFILPVDKESDS